MTNNKQQTAVEWLEKQTRKSEWHSLKRGEIFEQAKEMEKEQKKHAYDWGETNAADECNGDGATHENFEEYYKETYGGGEQ